MTDPSSDTHTGRVEARQSDASHLHVWRWHRGRGTFRHTWEEVKSLRLHRPRLQRKPFRGKKAFGSLPKPGQEDNRDCFLEELFVATGQTQERDEENVNFQAQASPFQWQGLSVDTIFDPWQGALSLIRIVSYLIDTNKELAADCPRVLRFQQSDCTFVRRRGALEKDHSHHGNSK